MMVIFWATVWYNLRMSWNICFLFKRLEAPWEFFLGANRVSVCCLWELHFLLMTLDYDSCTNLMLEGNDFLALGIEHTYTPMAKKQVGQSIKLRCWRDVWNSVSQIGAKILFCSQPELPWQQDIWMELSQQYNDNVPAKSFYVHMFLEEKKGNVFPLAHPHRVRTLFGDRWDFHIKALLFYYVQCKKPSPWPISWPNQTLCMIGHFHICLFTWVVGAQRTLGAPTPLFSSVLINIYCGISNFGWN